MAFRENNCLAAKGLAKICPVYIDNIFICVDHMALRTDWHPCFCHVHCAHTVYSEPRLVGHRDLAGFITRETQYHFDCRGRYQSMVNSQWAMASRPADAAHAGHSVVYLDSDYPGLV